MNIFEYYLDEIKNLTLSRKDFLDLDKLDNLQGVNLEVPPENFDFDLSCNIALVLGRKNKINAKTLALRFKELFNDKIRNFSEIEIAGPGFLNITLSKSAIKNNVNEILKNNSLYGSTKNN